MIERSDTRIRNLSVDDLGLQLPITSADQGKQGPSGGTVGMAATLEPLPADHELLQMTRELLERYGGVILSGPPGTSKSYFAARLALAITGSGTRVRFIQFHPSYQYEDFIEGYVPTDSGFKMRAKHLIEMAEDAEESPELQFVIVIDELSRGDAARIFGEALTYVERTKRGLTFSLASGREFAIPENLAFVATMNPYDRGVDEVDAAFERRFAKVPLDPSEEILHEFLTEANLPEPHRGLVEGFFRFANQKASSNPYGAIGHTYFLGVSSVDDLRRLWRHQLRFLFEKAYQLDAKGQEEIDRQWQRVLDAADQAEENGQDGDSPTSDEPLIT